MGQADWEDYSTLFVNLLNTNLHCAVDRVLNLIHIMLNRVVFARIIFRTKLAGWTETGSTCCHDGLKQFNLAASID